MQPSYSENTTGSKRCCNRSTCPFYCHPQHSPGLNSQSTPYLSAVDGSSTQFLYFGQNFRGNPSGEVMEFQDCNSESDVQRSLPSLARSVHQAAASLQRVDSVNYGMILKQIIVLSNKLLEHTEQKNRNGHGGSSSVPQRLLPNNLPESYPSPQMGPNQYSGVQQMASPHTYTHQQGFGASYFGGQPGQGGIRGNEIGTSMTMGPIPVDMRMLHIEPVHLTIPFTLHFQSMATDERAQGHIPSSVMEPIRTAAVSSPVPPHPTTATSLAFEQHKHAQTTASLVNQGQFPLSLGYQADVYVSEAKFPPVQKQLSSGVTSFDHKPVTSHISQDKILKESNAWCFQPSEPTLECTLEEACEIKREFREHSGESSQSPTNAEYTVTEVDKAVQTEKPARRSPQTGDKKKPKDIALLDHKPSQQVVGEEHLERNISEMPKQTHKMVSPERCICKVCTCQPKSATSPPESQSESQENEVQEQLKREISEMPKQSSGRCICEVCTCPSKTKSKPPLPPKPQIKGEPDMDISEMKAEPEVPPKPPRKAYRLALPQHKDLDICNKCRFQPSPLFDSDGNVFCPGKCGCCLCPWKPRVVGNPQRHEKFKVCKCRERLTIFTQNNSGNLDCSNSFFDVCPCREKAEEKFIEMYNCEMYNDDDTLKDECWGEEVLLSDVVEIKKRPSKRLYRN